MIHSLPTDRPTAAVLDTDGAFRNELVLLIPRLRGFARSLGSGPAADDLAQEALLNAWRYRRSFQPGTSLKAWAFTILRNVFLSQARRSWRVLPLEPEVAENTLVATDDRSGCEDLLDVRNAMEFLPRDQREALILIGPAQLSYEEAADVCSCAVGTVKSRVSRARAALTAIMAGSAGRPKPKTVISATDVFETMLQQAAALQRRLSVSTLQAA